MNSQEDIPFVLIVLGAAIFISQQNALAKDLPKAYVLGFLRPHIQPQSPSNVTLYISTQDPRGAFGMIEIPLSMGHFWIAGFPMNISIAQYEIQTVNFPAASSSLDVRIETERNRGIHVVSMNGADLDITAFSSNIWSGDTFLVHPCQYQQEKLSYLPLYRYFIFSASCQNGTNSILIIPCTSGGQIGNRDIKYQLPDEEPIKLERLRQFETFVISRNFDLTGTIVTSPFPLAVFSDLQCSDKTMCGHAIEQIPPDLTYGIKFFVMPFENVYETGYTLRIGSTVDNNEVNISCNYFEENVTTEQSSVIIDSGEFIEHLTHQLNYCYIETRRPSVIMQYKKTNTDDRDSAMTLIPPVEQYKKNYIVIPPSLSDKDYENTICYGIIVPTSVFRFKPTFIPGGTHHFRAILCSSEEVCGWGGHRNKSSYPLPDVILIHFQSEAIFVSSYGRFGHTSYANPAGMEFKPIGVPIITTYNVNVTEGLDEFARVQYKQTGGYLDWRSIFASTISTSEGRAEAASDYTAVPIHRLAFPIYPKIGEHEVDVEINILDDDAAENLEYFEVYFLIDSQEYAGFFHPISKSRVYIYDDDEDVDECSAASDVCPQSTICVNTHGSFKCVCESGYFYDEVSCRDTDECSNGTHNCDPNASCMNSFGSFICMCYSGYTGNGTSCQDVDECSADSDVCPQSAICVNTHGSFECVCEAGYFYDEVDCRDINECSTNTHNCDPNASCMNSLGSFTCKCHSGYTGNGTSCQDINECNTNTSNCDANAQCVNLPGSFSCSCESDYTGNGVYCIELEECKKKCKLRNSRCVFTSRDVSCGCRLGYSLFRGAACISESTVFCYASSDCSNNSMTGIASTADCCSHEVSPFGLSYIVPGDQGCHKCQVEFGFVVNTFTAMESSDPYLIDVAFFSGQSSRDFFLNLQFVGVSAEATDLILSSTRLHIPKVQHQDGLHKTSASLMFITDLVSQEGDESFVLNLIVDDGMLEIDTLLHDRFFGVITDATNVNITLTEKNCSSLEGNPVEVTVNKSAFLANPVVLTIILLTFEEADARGLSVPEISPISKANTKDFNNSAIAQAFEADEGSDLAEELLFHVQVFDDDVIESIQQFIVYLSLNSSVNSSLINIEQRICRCCIVDNDELTIGFQLNMYDFFVPESRDFYALIMKEENKRIEHEYYLIISAYAILPKPEPSPEFKVNKSISVNANVETFEIHHCDHRAIEYNITIVHSNVQLNQSHNYLHTIFRIFEADYHNELFLDIKFEELIYTYNESNIAKICVIVNNSATNISSDLGIRLQYTTALGTADSLDFQETTIPSLFLVFYVNSTTYRKCFEIPLSSDRFFESLEYFYVHLHIDNGHSWFNRSLPQTKVFIQDESVLAIGFSSEHYITWEQNLQLELFNVNFIHCTVDVCLMLQSIRDRYDRRILNFSIGVHEPRIIIDENDNIFELDENWQVELKFSETISYSRLAIVTNTTLLTIKDDDALHFSTNSLLVENEAPQFFCIFLDDGTPGELIVSLNIASDDNSGNATVGVDYAPIPPTTLQFSMDKLSHEVPVLIIHDLIPDSKEYFEIVILNVSITNAFGDSVDASDEINSRISMSGKVFIHENIRFSFSLDTYVVNEDAGLVSLEIVRQDFASETVSILFQTVDESASSIDVIDFINTTEVLVFFSPDENQKTVNIIVIDDEFPEINENFTATLSSNNETLSSIIKPAKTTVIIADNDLDAPASVISSSILTIVVALAVLIGLLLVIVIIVIAGIALAKKANKSIPEDDIYATIEDIAVNSNVIVTQLNESFDAESFESISDDVENEVVDNSAMLNTEIQVNSTSEMTVINDKLITTPKEAYGNRPSPHEAKVKAILSGSERTFETGEYTLNKADANRSIAAFTDHTISVVDKVINDAYGIKLSEPQLYSENISTELNEAYASNLDTSDLQHVEQIETEANEAYSTSEFTIVTEVNEAYGSKLDSESLPLPGIIAESNEAYNYGSKIDSEKLPLSSINVESNEAYGITLDNETPLLSSIIVESNEAYGRKLRSELQPRSGSITVESNEAYSMNLASIMNSKSEKVKTRCEESDVVGIISFEPFFNAAETGLKFCAPQLERSDLLGNNSTVNNTYSPASQLKRSRSLPSLCDNSQVVDKTQNYTASCSKIE